MEADFVVQWLKIRRRATGPCPRRNTMNHTISCPGCGRAVDLITGALHDFGGGSQLPPYSAAYWKMEK